jgi:hypothetical protein
MRHFSLFCACFVVGAEIQMSRDSLDLQMTRAFLM